MVTVALAGATTGFGLTVLRTFLTTSHPHTLVLLSRTPQPDLIAAHPDLSVQVVDYTSHTSLVSALSGVHTVLSLIGGSQTALETAQIALLAAAKEANVTRFAPSEYAGISNDGIDLYAGKLRVWDAVVASGLQYTRFSGGIFLNLLGTGTPKAPTDTGRRYFQTGQDEALAGLRPWNFILNLQAGTADLPGRGDQPVVFTEMSDVAMFVLKALDLPVWPEMLGMRGDVMSFRQLMEMVEKVQGRRFLVRENSIADMQRIADEQPAKKFYNQVRIQIARGDWSEVPPTLNEKFPEVRTTTAKLFLEKWWKDLKLGDAAWAEDYAFSG